MIVEKIDIYRNGFILTIAGYKCEFNLDFNYLSMDADAVAEQFGYDDYHSLPENLKDYIKNLSIIGLAEIDRFIMSEWTSLLSELNITIK